MYEMHPEWGPSRHDPDSPTFQAQKRAQQAALDPRDGGGQRPDDN